MKLNQGDIVSITLDPTKGREQKGVRPAVIISSNAFHNSGLVLICPLTTTLHMFGGDVLVSPNKKNGLKKDSEVLVGHIRSVSQDRVYKKIGSIEYAELVKIFEGIDLLCNR